MVRVGSAHPIFSQRRRKHMNALKRLILGVLLAFGLTFGGVRNAVAAPGDTTTDAVAVADAAQCYDVYYYVGTIYQNGVAIADVYEYQYTRCYI
jgi:hypothetical protein